MADDELQRDAVDLLCELIRIDTVNPPGGEAPAIELLRRVCDDAGLETTVLAADPERPNLVATLRAPSGADGPVLGLLAHVDTVLADPDAWSRDPWSGEVADGFVWGRGAIDMKSQVAAEAVAVASLARGGWRPARGAVKLLFVSDEETGGAVGARWLCEAHPDAVRCDMLLNEGGGAQFQFGGARRYGVCCAEKDIHRFTITAHGHAGHAAVPTAFDNALLKLAPVLTALADPPPGYAMTRAPAELLRALGFDPDDPGTALRTIADADPALHRLLAPMFSVTLAPTMISASQKINVIPGRAEIRVDCRVPAGLGEAAARRRIDEVLELSDDVTVEFIEHQPANASPPDGELYRMIERWVGAADPGATAVPVTLNGFSDSSWFRAAFPECAAYGFFPQRHQGFLDAAPLMHGADERIDVRDLGFAAGFYRDCAVGLLG